MEKVNCLCGSENLVKVFSYKDINYKTSGIFTLVKCSKCGLRFLNPRPSPSEIHIYYPSIYQESKIIEFRIINGYYFPP